MKNNPFSSWNTSQPEQPKEARDWKNWSNAKITSLLSNWIVDTKILGIYKTIWDTTEPPFWHLNEVLPQWECLHSSDRDGWSETFFIEPIDTRIWKISISTWGWLGRWWELGWSYRERCNFEFKDGWKIIWFDWDGDELNINNTDPNKLNDRIILEKGWIKYDLGMRQESLCLMARHGFPSMPSIGEPLPIDDDLRNDLIHLGQLLNIKSLAQIPTKENWSFESADRKKRLIAWIRENLWKNIQPIRAQMNSDRWIYWDKNDWVWVTSRMFMNSYDRWEGGANGLKIEHTISPNKIPWVKKINFSIFKGRKDSSWDICEYVINILLESGITVTMNQKRHDGYVPIIIIKKDSANEEIDFSSSSPESIENMNVLELVSQVLSSDWSEITSKSSPPTSHLRN